MDINQISQLVGSLGFPILACVFLFKFLTQTMKENTQALNTLSDTIADLKANTRYGMWNGASSPTAISLPAPAPPSGTPTICG